MECVIAKLCFKGGTVMRIARKKQYMGRILEVIEDVGVVEKRNDYRNYGAYIKYLSLLLGCKNLIIIKLG